MPKSKYSPIKRNKSLRKNKTLRRNRSNERDDQSSSISHREGEEPLGEIIETDDASMAAKEGLDNASRLQMKL